MKLNLISMETVSTPEQIAVDCQDQIIRHRLIIEELEARRDEAIAQALANGVKKYAGYRFAERKPADTLSEKKFAEKYPEVMDGYISWFQQTHGVRLSKAELSKYLDTTECTNPDRIIKDITEPGKGPNTVSIVKLREADE